MTTVLAVSYPINRDMLRTEYFFDRELAEDCARQVRSKVRREEHKVCPVCDDSGELPGYNAGILCPLCDGDGLEEAAKGRCDTCGTLIDSEGV